MKCQLFMEKRPSMICLGPSSYKIHILLSANYLFYMKIKRKAGTGQCFCCIIKWKIMEGFGLWLIFMVSTIYLTSSHFCLQTAHNLTDGRQVLMSTFKLSSLCCRSARGSTGNNPEDWLCVLPCSVCEVDSASAPQFDWTSGPRMVTSELPRFISAAFSGATWLNCTDDRQPMKPWEAACVTISLKFSLPAEGAD